LAQALAAAADRTELASDLEARLSIAQAQAAAALEGMSAGRTALASLEAELAQALLDLTRSEQDAAARIAELESALAASEASSQAAGNDAVSALSELEAALAAALTAQMLAEADASRLSEAEQRAALLAQANLELEATAEAASAESQRQIAALNQQVAALRTQLGQLQALLDDARDRDAAAEVQVETLGADLNAALAQLAAESAARAAAEAEAARLSQEEVERLAAEAQELERYRSEFFGRLRELLEGREGVQIDGDRFIFSSEVLFESGSAELADEGLVQIANVAELLLEISDDIPDTIDWIIRVDGHTDNVQMRPGGTYANNWELSQARALSVVLYMSEELGVPPFRLAATGFGEYRPLNPANTPEARAQNRRIELKLTER